MAFAALIVVTVMGRVLRAPPMPVPLLIFGLPYLYITMMGLAFSLWVAFPDRKAFPLVLCSTVVVAVIMWGPSYPANPEAADGTPIRLMSWNVQRLWGLVDETASKRCVVRAVKAQDPDVLTLLEVSLADVEELSAELDLACTHTTYREGGSRTKGGLASCVRGPAWRLQDGKAHRFVDAENWYYVFAEVAHGEDVFNLLAVHFYPYGSTGGLPTGRVVPAQGAQSAALLARVERFHDPTLVAGDFNSTRDAALHASLRSHLTDAWARGATGLGGTVFPLGIPLRVDHVYASEDFAVQRATAPVADCSDHLPVVVDLVLRD